MIAFIHNIHEVCRMNKCYLNFRTDMADERVDTYKRVNNLTEIDGVKVENIKDNAVTTTIVDVLNEQGSHAVRKEVGKYITMELTDVEYLDEKEKENIIHSLSTQIKSLINIDFKSVMIVGLGNINVTPDALGPKVVSFVDITRHILRYARELVTEPMNEVSAISPGVLGTTGIETEEIIQSVVEKVKPDLVIAIDSLASMSVSRVGKTIQLSNTGITPGQGVGNARQGLNIQTLKVPVIAIGVPTVVDMATITNHAIDKVLDSVDDEINNYTNNLDNTSNKVMEILNSENRYNRIANILHTENYIVTPKEIDAIIDKISEIIASGINEAV